LGTIRIRSSIRACSLSDSSVINVYATFNPP
jgi:hypothetical protein